MYNRRKFLKVTSAASALATFSSQAFSRSLIAGAPAGFPIVISTWDFWRSGQQRSLDGA